MNHRNEAERLIAHADMQINSDYYRGDCTVIVALNALTHAVLALGSQAPETEAADPYSDILALHADLSTLEGRIKDLSDKVRLLQRHGQENRDGHKDLNDTCANRWQEAFDAIDSLREDHNRMVVYIETISDRMCERLDQAEHALAQTRAE